VDIPKASGGTRPLGIPTVADRVAQEVVRRYLEPFVEPVFHADSYGYRPGRSAIDAVGTARQRCWRYDWVLDIDIKAFFDSIDHALLLRAVRRHTGCLWVLLYVERWLKAPMQREDGVIEPREAGTPQGGVISPILANLFLHYGFDMWMARTWRAFPFKRYADDAICHCRTRDEAEALQAALQERFADCRLVLHPQKTKIVYCKDTNRKDAPCRDIRHSRLLVSAETGGVARRQIRRLVPAGSRRQGAQEDARGNPALESPDPDRQGPRRSRTDVQSVHPGLDQLLQPLLQVGALRQFAPDRLPPEEMGAPQIQALSA
jgi:RNA-directed DNA polymerase